MTERIAYGDDPLQFADLTLPPGEGPFPVVVFIHGGFWRSIHGLDLARPQATDAAANGVATWNIEYRRMGDAGGGYPGTLADIAAALDHLARIADECRLDLERVAVVGHSAGGHLALWVGQRQRLSGGLPGADPVVVPRLVVGQAPVADLSSNLDLGDGAVEAFVGASPGDAPERYAIADPALLLPVVVPQLIVQGRDDVNVPAERTEDYERRASDPSLHVRYFDGADHFDVIDPAHESWAWTLDAIAAAFGGAARAGAWSRPPAR